MNKALSFLGVVVGAVAVAFAAFIAIWNWWAGLAILLTLTTILFAFAWRGRKRKPRNIPAPPAREWHVLDEEYGGLADGGLRENLTALKTPWHVNKTSPFRNNPVTLTDAQKDLAAEDAAFKRYADGLGDPQ